MLIESIGNRLMARLRRFARMQEPTADIQGTPSNERLIQLAQKYPPPQHWFEGDEEDLF